MTFWDFASQHECITLALAFLVYLGVEVVSANAVGVASVLRRKP